MLTGDHPDTARAVARTVGLMNSELPVVMGIEVDLMSDAALRASLSRDAVIARVDPQQKLRIVRVLQAAGEVVVVTGDGVNDAPSLRDGARPEPDELAQIPAVVLGKSAPVTTDILIQRRELQYGASIVRRRWGRP